MKGQCKQGMIPILVFRLVLVTLTIPCRMVVSVSVVWATELLLNMRKLNPPTVPRIAKKTDISVVDLLTQSSVTMIIEILKQENLYQRYYQNLSPKYQTLKFFLNPNLNFQLNVSIQMYVSRVNQDGMMALNVRKKWIIVQVKMLNGKL